MRTAAPVPVVLCLLAASFGALPACKAIEKRAGALAEPAPSAGELPPGAVPVPSGAAPLSSAPLPVPTVLSNGAPSSFAPIAKRADVSVVTITTLGEEGGGSLLGRRSHREARGLGTGFVVDKGVILTNNHVVEEAEQITVQLGDGRAFPGKVVGRDPATDVAVLRLEGAGELTPLPFGDSDGLEVGDWVVAIGNPFGLSHTVSAGIVSAKGRTREDVPLDPSGYYDFLQTDASINPGNSGGPLLNLKGEVVGMNTAIRGGGAQGIGFSVPVNMLKQLVPALLQHGSIARSAIGVRIRDVRELLPDDRSRLGVDKGAVVEFVDPGGPAAKAKLALGDVIVGFDGKGIDRASHLQWLASMAGVGKTVNVRVAREGKQFDVPLTLSALGPLPKAKVPSR